MVAISVGCSQINPGSNLSKGRRTVDDQPPPADSSATDNTSGNAAIQDKTDNQDSASEPISIAGAFLTCIPLGNIVDPKGFSADCGLRKKSDNTLIKLPDTSHVRRAAAFNPNNDTYDLSIIKSPDPAWHWRILKIILKLLTYKLLVIEINGSKLDGDATVAYFLEPPSLTAATIDAAIKDYKSIPSGIPLDYHPWHTGQPADLDGNIENCANLWDYGFDSGSAQADFGWKDYVCEKAAHFACQSKTDPRDWIISADQGQWSESSGKCPATHDFSVPKSDDENTAFLLAAEKFFPADSTSHSVWMNAKKVVPSVNYFIIP